MHATGVGVLARAINAGDEDRVIEILRAGRAVRLVAPDDAAGAFRLGAALRSEVLDGYREYLRVTDADDAIRAFERYRILCAHRRGPAGVEPINRLVAGALEDAGLLVPAGSHYRGRPVLVTRNDYRVDLWNGDVGLLWDAPTDEDGVRAYFLSADGRRRVFSPSRLPPHETVWATSVHKSQGSEFDAVSVLLPLEPSPIVSRELLYTAVTRARERVSIHATEEVVRHAVRTRIQRASGLGDLLWRREPTTSKVYAPLSSDAGMSQTTESHRFL